jgi:hypothetical protein
MRGYLNFILVFVSVFFILILINASQIPSSISFSKAIAAERIYQTQMNSKEVVSQPIRQGGLAAFKVYNSTHFVYMCDPKLGGPADPLCFRMEEAALWTKAGAYSYLAAADLKKFDPDIEIDYFCMPSMNDIISTNIALNPTQVYPGMNLFSDPGKNFSDYSLELIASATKDKSGNPIYSAITLPICMEIIYPVIEEDPQNKLITDPKLKKNPDLKKIRIVNGIIASEAYYQNFNASSIVYIPAGFEVVP